MRLYEELSDWWHLLSRPEDYAEEAAIFREALERVADRRIETLLELGSGGGNNASHLKGRFRMTLVEPSDGMRARSRALNPECVHVPGDMRSVRLGRTFDAVLVHDAIMYMTTEQDLQAALATAFEHCRPGGVALFVPDDTRETWRPEAMAGGHDGGDRSLRYLAWAFDPDPADSWFTTAFALLLREGSGPLRCEHDEHRMGLFPRRTWLALLRRVGFQPATLPYDHSSFEPDRGRRLFLGTRPEE